MRGISAIFVILSHASLMLSTTVYPLILLDIPSLGVGVDLFFVISGLVTAGSLRHLESRFSSRKARLIAFYSRRATRIIPLAWLVAICTAGMAWASGYKDGFADVESALTFTSNFYWSSCFAGSATCEGKRFLSHYWSVATEALFWIGAPILLGFSRYYMRWITAIILVTGLFLERPWGGGLWTFRWEPFVIGLWLGRELETDILRNFLSRLGPMSLPEAIMMLFVAGLIASIIPDKLGGVAIVLVSCVCGWIVMRMILRGTPQGFAKPFAWIGQRSYALYLVHPAIYASVGISIAGVGGVISGLVSTFCASIFVAHWVTTRIDAPIQSFIRRL